MAKSLIKGDEVRQGNLIYLDAVSDEALNSFADTPLSEAMLLQLNSGTVAISPATAKQVMESYKTSGELVFAVRLQSDQAYIGVCRLANISWQARYAELFIGILDEAHFTHEILADSIQTILQFVYWEANLNRIYIHCVEDNLLMREAIEQASFTNEGHLRQEAYRNGQFLDICVYSILQREWTN